MGWWFPWNCMEIGSDRSKGERECQWWFKLVSLLQWKSGVSSSISGTTRGKGRCPSYKNPRTWFFLWWGWVELFIWNFVMWFIIGPNSVTFLYMKDTHLLLFPSLSPSQNVKDSYLLNIRKKKASHLMFLGTRRFRERLQEHMKICKYCLLAENF